jgi:hypothetical protein
MLRTESPPPPETAAGRCGAARKNRERWDRRIAQGWGAKPRHDTTALYAERGSQVLGPGPGPEASLPPLSAHDAAPGIARGRRGSSDGVRGRRGSREVGLAARATSDRHFRKAATEYDRKPGIKRSSCTAE